MVLEKGDFVRINYTGRIKETGKTFDTTVESVAKKQGIYDEKIKFKAAPIVIGANHVLKGLDEALIGLEVGDKKRVVVTPEKGYGERDPKLVKIVPMKDFKKQGLKPVPGMMVEAEGKIGKVQSVGAGRVRVDFNYELAGKVLEYDVTVEEKVNKSEEKIRLLLELHLPYADPNDHEIKIEEGKAIITLSDIAKIKREAVIGKHYVARDIFEYLKGIEEVEFREVFEKPKPAEKKKEKGKTQAEKEKKEKPEADEKKED
jgi:FKBP-type peptidyl-prolyl cis-trans isomerase SlyD